jgi:hydroxymethylbilane synthase
MADKIIIGTRGSKLALWQAEYVKSLIKKNNPSCEVSLQIIKTKGDKILDVPLAKVGGKGLFVKEIEEALLNKKIDIAVHSMKDMPADIPEGLCIGSVPKRENPKDVLISKNKNFLLNLKNGAKIGTSSLRRAAQLLIKRQDFKIVSLRGNVETRLKKLQDEKLDAIVLAAAGIIRLGYEYHVTEYIDENILLPAVGQGALCVEVREYDEKTLNFVKKFECKDTRKAVLGERAFLKKLEGGCQTPIAGFGTIKDDLFTLTGLVADTSGKTFLKKSITGNAKNSENIGIELAESLLSMGADKILKTINNIS